MSINSLLEDSQTIFGGKLKPASWVGHLDIQKDVSSKSRTVHAVFNGNSGSDWLFCAAFCVSTLVWFHIRSWDEVSFLLVMLCSAAYCKTCQLHLQEFTTWSQYTSVQCNFVFNSNSGSTQLTLCSFLPLHPTLIPHKTFCWSCSELQHTVKLFSSVVKSSFHVTLLGPNMYCF